MSSSSSPGSSSCEESFYLQDMAQEADNPSSPLAKSTLAAVSTPSKTQDLNMHRLPYASHNSYSPFDICPSRENGFFEELETLGRNRKASKKPPKPRGPRFMWFRAQLFKPILLADYVSGVLWYNVLLLLQWCILHLMPRRWKEQRGYAHLFKYPHSEEGRKAEEEQARRSVEREEKRKNVRRLRTRSTLTKWTRVVFGLWLLVKRWFLWFWFPKQRPFIVFVDNLRRRCMTNPDKRYRFWKIVYTLIIVLVACFFIGRYTTQQIEKVRYVTPETVHEQTGTSVTNIVSVNRFTLPNGYGTDQEWLLYDCQKCPRLTSKDMLFGYVELDTPSFGSVNISIDDVVHRMKQDSKEKGLSLPQPCVCGAHYGLPINVILLRDIENEDVRILYEPTVVQATSDIIKGTVSVDSLVVPNKRARRIRKFPLGDRVPISPMDNLRILSLQDKYKKEAKEAIETYTYPEEMFTNIVDLTDKPASSSVSKWIFNRLSIPIGTVKEHADREITVGYEHIVVRSLEKDGSKAMATNLHSPHSICVQRCIAATSYKIIH